MTKKTTILLTDSNYEAIQEIKETIQQKTDNNISMSKIINIAIKEFSNNKTNKESSIQHCINELQRYNVF